MKIVVLICRVLLGAGFVLFGLNGLHPFMPMPPIPPDSLVGRWDAVMMGSGWMKAIAAMQLLGGLLILVGGTAPLGLAILAPILFNVLCFHVFLMGGSGIVPGLVCALLEIVLLYAYRANFSSLFATKATPAV